MTSTRDTVLSAATLAGIGLIAGLVGSAAMLAGQKAEMAITGREPSDTPAEAIETISGVDVEDEAAKGELSTAGHFAFGTALGLGLAAAGRVPEPARGALFFAGAWSAGAGLVTGLGLAEPPTKWSAKELATDLAHHLVYAATAAATFAGLRRLARV